MTEIKTFADIPQFPQAHHKVNVSWGFLETWLKDYEGTGLELDPDFQRAHVWTQAQQTAYVEYILRGGEGSRIIYWNQESLPGSGHHDPHAALVLVDGKQRMEAVRAFLRHDVRAFGKLCSDFGSRLLRLSGPDFVMQIASLKTRREVLEWYLYINAGGTPHTKDELDKVRALLAEEP